MVSGVIAKYSKTVRKVDSQVVILVADYFHEDAIRCTYLIDVEKSKVRPLVGLCAEKNGDRKIEGCSFSEIIDHVVSEVGVVTKADTVEISENEFVHLVRQYGFVKDLLKEVAATTNTYWDTSVFDFAKNTFQTTQ